jgi:hypothetical protein
MRSIAIASNVSGVESSDCLCHDQVDDEIELGRLFDRNIARLSPRKILLRLRRRFGEALVAQP